MNMNRCLAIVLLSACLSQTCSSQTTPPQAAQVPPRTIGDATQQNPNYIPGGFDLPNGWRITPAGKAIATIEDMVLNTVVSPDGKIIVATHSGYLPHGIDVIEVKTRKLVQQIPLKTTWLGLAWSGDGHTLYVSGGNATGAKNIARTMAPIYEFTYKDGRLSETPTGGLVETIDPKEVWWAGVAYLPGKHEIYAANRGTGVGPSNVVVFDAKTRKIVTRIPVEINPYATVLSKDDRRLFVSNWASERVTVI